MSSVVIAGDTSGTVTLQAPAVAGSTTITLPTTSGTALTTADVGTTANKLVRLDGSAKLPAVDGSALTGVGVWAKIAATTISSSVATVDYTNLGSYAALRFTFNNIRPANDGAIFSLRLSSDNGATFIATQTYSGGGEGGSMEISGNIGNAATDGGYAGTVFMTNFNIAQKTTARAISTEFSTTATLTKVELALTQTGQTAMNAVRFFMSTGNIAAGNILVEGWTGS